MECILDTAGRRLGLGVTGFRKGLETIATLDASATAHHATKRRQESDTLSTFLQIQRPEQMHKLANIDFQELESQHRNMIDQCCPKKSGGRFRRPPAEGPSGARGRLQNVINDKLSKYKENEQERKPKLPGSTGDLQCICTCLPKAAN